MKQTLLVTDTHPLIYFFCDGGRKLSKKVKQAFGNAIANQDVCIFVPTPALLEVAMLVENERIRLDRDFEKWVDDLFSHRMINPIALDQETVKVFYTVRYHTDPFDRAIVASALQLGLPLITNDAKMHEKTPCDLYWD